MGLRAHHLIFGCLVIASVALIFLTPKWADEIGRHFDENPAEQSALGQMKLLNGRASSRLFGQLDFENWRGSLPLHHLETLNVEDRSQVELALADYRLIVTGPAQVVAERWSASDPKSPLVLHWLSGRFEMAKEGERGRLFLVHGSEMADPRGILRAHGRILQISQLNLAEPVPAPQPPKKSDSVASADSQTNQAENETLTNEYMDERIAQEKEQFQRCQNNALREHGDVKGEILIGLTINVEGKVDGARVLNSTLASESLKSCVLEIFRRLHFKPFKGEPIVRSYPLNFE